eukprot:CAMPEP_0181042196 /NCGR_PEP_ID=MMETSP1070-20121207/12017_1 /TAXON_ID=265543 /ORGANISM="Minutocellus polymorphus, Strain NH13" /LENGTH=145 /DNA_ID=CAMNT_0023120385 /DNA_START=67 /DNA_END=504 /DNA_ORIENTATION=+
MVYVKDNSKRRGIGNIVSTLVYSIVIAATLVTLVNIVPPALAGIARVVFRVKVLPLDEYDSLNAELDKTKNDLDALNGTDMKVKEEAFANYEAFNAAKRQKAAAEEQNAADKKKIASLEWKVGEMEKKMAEAKTLAASFAKMNKD